LIVSKNDAPLLLTNKESLSESEESKKVEDRLVSLPSQESSSSSKSSNALIARRTPVRVPEPKWHAPWELSAVVSGHLGWVRSIAFDPSNEWFATGAADRTIKIWDLAKCCAGVEGGLKLTLTGHISTVRGLAISSRHPYLFSVGEDKMVNCWDLEYNKIIRHYHGHLSGVFCLSLHPTLDLLITGGRDSVARVWDIRTKHQIHVLGGHSDAVSSILTNSVNPQVVTASHDSTIKLWDLVAGRAISTLTQHKKAVRGLCASQKEMSFISASADNIKKWQTRDGRFLSNFSGHNSVVNCVAANEDGVLVSCGDNGSMHFWDYETGYNFQTTKTIVQPGTRSVKDNKILEY
jgi:pleiotropic regulator 1